MPSNRRLAAIMFTDIVGYTAAMQQNEQNAIRMVDRHQEVLEKCVNLHGGEVHQYYGDGSLSIFQSATEAVQCGMDIQKELKTEPAVPLRIGIHIGEILSEGNKIFGDGVNLASRIESLGQAGTVMYSENVHQKIKNNNLFQSVSLGKYSFKNVSEPMEVFALANDGFPVPEQKTISGKLSAPAPRSLVFSWKKSLFFIILIGLVTAITWYATVENRGDKATQSAGQYSIMVLPFDNLSDLPNQQYLVNGITDELRSQLFSIRNLKVISRASSKFYKDRQISLAELGRELGVSYILEGTVQRSNEMVKVNVQLSNTRTQEVEWSPAAFREKLEDVFLLQNKISKQIADQLKLSLSAGEARQLDKIPTRNIEAYLSYQRAQELIKNSDGHIAELDSAVQLLKQSIELDPNFSLAYVGLSEAYLSYIFWGRYPTNQILPQALEAAFKALELDDEKVEIYAALGAINFYQYNAPKAREYLEKAIALSPNYHPPYEWLAWINIFENKKQEAIRLFSKAHELEPLSAKYLADQAYGYYYLGLYDEGQKYIAEVLPEFPNENFLLWVQGCLYVAQQDYDKAIATFHKRTAGTETNWMLGYAYAKKGDTEAAQKILNLLLEKREHQHVPAVMIAAVYMALDDRENALNWLEQDWQERGQGVMLWGLKSDIRFAPLRDEPRFRKIVNNIRLE